MPGIRCAVFGCNNSFVNAKKNGDNIKFFPFPKAVDLTTKAIREEWIESCNRLGDFNPDLTRVCSIHFSDQDFKRDFQNELLGLPLKKMLKKTAVPTLFLTSQKPQSTHFTAVGEGARSNIYGVPQVASKDGEKLCPRNLNYRSLYHKMCLLQRKLAEVDNSSTIKSENGESTLIKNKRWFQPY